MVLYIPYSLLACSCKFSQYLLLTQGKTVPEKIQFFTCIGSGLQKKCLSIHKAELCLSSYGMTTEVYLCFE